MKKRKPFGDKTGSSESPLPVVSSSERPAGAAPDRFPAPRTERSLIAKKDFVIRQEPYERVICAGEDISDVPEKYHPNLRTEGVL